MTPSRIEPATFQLVAQCLNQLRHHSPPLPHRYIQTNRDLEWIYFSYKQWNETRSQLLLRTSVLTVKERTYELIEGEYSRRIREKMYGIKGWDSEQNTKKCENRTHNGQGNRLQQRNRRETAGVWRHTSVAQKLSIRHTGQHVTEIAVSGFRRRGRRLMHNTKDIHTQPCFSAFVSSGTLPLSL